MRGLRTTMKSGPRSPQSEKLEKALAQKRRPNTAEKKKKKVPFTEPSRQKHSALKDENGVELLLDFGTMYRHWVGSRYIHTHSFIHLFHSNLQSVYRGLPTKHPTTRPRWFATISPQNQLSLAGPPSVSGCLSCAPVSAHMSPHSLCLRG